MEVEKAKMILSRKPSATIKIGDFSDGFGLVETLTRDQFEELNSDLFSQTMTSVDCVLVDAGTTEDEVDEACLPKYLTYGPVLNQHFTGRFSRRIVEDTEGSEATPT
ncbi:Endoplasmic reticulum chaperone BiP [Marasmius tenuissimus]|nr:Endoplasmic reticulum chaperone BiP [Marasmius tenuissimus]